ncbi:TPA: cupin [Serratia marcescens]|uniref:cupin n=1 Tax=Serratia marcescens TaxID=615 RepID=UPI0023AF852B|nr:cupin [Serratia marcescens]WEE06885.1 cupin [Serratia marcescens]WJD90012.1 cupin [Serratia marcescens]HCD1614763.1 cupin [Serratia marcescens]
MTTFTAKTAFLPLDNGLARREGVMSDGSPAAEVRFEAGAFGQLQKPAHALQTRVISGEFEFTLGGDTRIVRAGESLILPANVASGCFCLSAGMLLEIHQTR